VRVPETAGVGRAEITIAFDAWKEGKAAPSKHFVTIVAPKTNRKQEAVSSRLKQELIHPNRTSVPMGIRYSPDGQRIIAGDYPGGVVVIWDAATGKQLTSIETGYGYRGSSDYFFLSPDWRVLYVSHEKRKFERVEQDGKRMMRWEFDGDVRTWDLTTGQVQRTYKHQPPRNIIGMTLTADGGKFVTYDELPGVYERSAKRVLSLWDAASGEHRALPDGLEFAVKLSPDGRMLATTKVDGDGYAQAVKVFDTETGGEKWSIPVAERNARIYASAYSPDGRLLVGDWRVFEKPKQWDSWTCSLKIWDAATGKELASYPAEKNDSFYNAQFSPDGRTLAVGNWQGSQKRLLLIRTADFQVTREIVLERKTEGHRLIMRKLAFSSDGKWLAIITQAMADTRISDEPDVRDVPQARIHLVDVAAGQIRETLIAPPGFPAAAAFSPDGATLATGGHGRVLLWDVSDLAKEANVRGR
jgi:WD40 repeat protein